MNNFQFRGKWFHITNVTGIHSLDVCLIYNLSQKNVICGKAFNSEECAIDIYCHQYKYRLLKRTECLSPTL